MEDSKISDEIVNNSKLRLSITKNTLYIKVRFRKTGIYQTTFFGHSNLTSINPMSSIMLLILIYLEILIQQLSN